MGVGKKKQPACLKGFNGLVGTKPREKVPPPVAYPLPSAPLLPSVLPGIDIHDGLMRVGNNPRLFVNLLRKFSINQADTLSAIKTALESGRKQRALDHIHALKGVSGNLGARRLRQAAKAVEIVIKRNQKEWRGAMKTLSSAMEELFATIASLPPPQESSLSVAPAKDPKPKDISALAHELKRLLTESDTRSAETLEQLKAIVIEPVLTQRLQALDKPLENYDFEQALEVLNGIPGI